MGGWWVYRSNIIAALALVADQSRAEELEPNLSIINTCRKNILCEENSAELGSVSTAGYEIRDADCQVSLPCKVFPFFPCIKLNKHIIGGDAACLSFIFVWRTKLVVEGRAAEGTDWCAVFSVASLDDLSSNDTAQGGHTRDNLTRPFNRNPNIEL